MCRSFDRVGLNLPASLLPVTLSATIAAMPLSSHSYVKVCSPPIPNSAVWSLVHLSVFLRFRLDGIFAFLLFHKISQSFNFFDFGFKFSDLVVFRREEKDTVPLKESRFISLIIAKLKIVL